MNTCISIVIIITTILATWRKFGVRGKMIGHSNLHALVTHNYERVLLRLTERWNLIKKVFQLIVDEFF